MKSDRNEGTVKLLAAESELVREESFLPLLHDDDAEVQHLVEMALRKRKLTDDDIALARMISAKDASTRMRVFHHLPSNLRECQIFIVDHKRCRTFGITSSQIERLPFDITPVLGRVDT